MNPKEASDFLYDAYYQERQERRNEANESPAPLDLTQFWQLIHDWGGEINDEFEGACLKALRELRAARERIEALTGERDDFKNKWARGWKKPGHGPCCTCQVCGKDHDLCRCDLDEVADKCDTLREALRGLVACVKGASRNHIVDCPKGDKCCCGIGPFETALARAQEALK